MRVPGRLFAVGFVLLTFTPIPIQAQYLYLDSNGDGVHDASDRLDTGSPTTIDIWLSTSARRDGSRASCNASPSTLLTINSWEIVLHAVGGTVAWGPLENVLPISAQRVTFADRSDTTDAVWYHNGWGGHTILPPGLYRVGRLQARVLSGDPSILVAPFNPRQPNDLTSFGTQCPASENDNTYKLGLDWFDANGLGDLTADPGGPYRALVGGTILFDGSGSIDPDGGLLSHAWAFGDGSGASGSTAAHAYSEAGEYVVTLTVTAAGRQDTGQTVAVVLPQVPPVANAGGPYAGSAGLLMYFNGMGSSDANGDPLSGVWYFGDGAYARGMNAFHTYLYPGDYKVILSVSDGTFSDLDSTVAVIARQDRPPVAVAGGPYAGFAGIPLAFTGNRSHDPDGDPLSYRWIFGDGGESRLEAPSHAYASEGSYEVILEVSDGALATSDATTATIRRVVGSPPHANAGGPYRGFVGQAIRFDGTRSSDADGDPLAYAWSFGDGSRSSTAAPTHSFAAPGTYSVVLAVSDGVRSAEARTEATVGDVGQARAFWPDRSSLALGAMEPVLLVEIEPVENSFSLTDVDPAGVQLTCDGSRAAPVPALGPATFGADADANGRQEITALFRGEDVRRLLGHLERPTSVDLRVEGRLREGGFYVATLPCRVVPAAGRFAAVIRPNPFNPRAMLSYSMTKAGRVSARLFDLAGRLVKTVLRDETLEAGTHEIPIDARGDGGGMLSSGIYFLQIAGPDGSVTTRVAVAK